MEPFKVHITTDRFATDFWIEKLFIIIYQLLIITIINCKCYKNAKGN